jgi:cytochrome c oxidase cbb3-type subunit 3
MADFVSDFWSWYIIILVTLSILACYALVYWMTKGSPLERKHDNDTTGHSWDGLEEYNNPLPKWWLNLFYISIFTASFYLVLYPGMGSFAGILGWSEAHQYKDQMEEAEIKYGPIFAKFEKEPIETLAKNEEALAIGKRLFLNYCTVCHGSDARGTTGYPNLRDEAWLYGGAPELIEASIMHGRNGIMPDMKANGLNQDDVKNLAQFVLSLSGREGLDNAMVAKGKEKFATICFACHGMEGKGNPALGAPNLTDTTWLYGASPRAVEASITKGRAGVMPAHGEFLGKAKVHLLSAYIYNISNSK